MKTPNAQTRAMSRTGAAMTVAVCLIVICVLPVIVLAIKALTAGGGFSFRPLASVLTDGRQWGLLGTSLAVALGTAFGATLVGAPIGYALEYVRVPSRRWLMGFVAMPFFMPPYVLATAWADVLGANGPLRRALPAGVDWPGPYNVSGLIFVQSLTYFPLVTFAVTVALRRFDARFEEAARLAGQGRRVFRAIVAPLTAPALLTGALAVFALSLLGFSVPSLLQVNTYPVEIYASSATYDYAVAMAQSLPLLGLCLAALAVWAGYLRPRHAWLTGRQRNRRPQASCALRTGLAFVCWGIVFVSVLVPLTALFMRSLPLHTYLDVWSTARGEFLISFLVACISATVTVLLAFFVTVFSRRKPAFITAQALSLLPFALSGPLLGLGLIAAWNRPGIPGLVYDSLAVVVIACVARYLVFANGVMAAGLRRLHPQLEEAAWMAGVSWWRTLLGVVGPLLLPYMIVCWGLLFIFSMGELDAVVLVCPPGQTTLAVRLFTLMHYGPGAYVAALSLLTVALMLVAAVATAAGYERWRRIVEVRD